MYALFLCCWIFECPSGLIRYIYIYLLELHTDEEEDSVVRMFHGLHDAEKQYLIEVFFDPGNLSFLASCATEQLS